MLISENKQFDIWSKELSIPIPAIDIVIFTVYKDELCLVLLKEEINGQASYVLPGGIIARGYTLEKNFDDILERKTGIKGVYKEQLYTFGDPIRDSRGHVISISYYALVSIDSFLNKVDFTKVSIVKYSEINENNIGFKDKKIGFDHLKIIKYAKQRLEWKLEYTNIAREILPDMFKISDLQKIYEIINSKTYDRRNFSKKILSLDIIYDTGKKDKSTNRPAKLFSFKDDNIKIIEDNSLI